jgi:hypothetical protein
MRNINSLHRKPKLRSKHMHTNKYTKDTSTLLPS